MDKIRNIFGLKWEHQMKKRRIKTNQKREKITKIFLDQKAANWREWKSREGY